MVELRLDEPKSPILFEVDGCCLVVMIYFLPSKAVAEAEAVASEPDVEGETKETAEPVAEDKPKAIYDAAPPQYTRTVPAAKPVLGPFTEIIDRWLDEDLSRPRKQRHTARRIYHPDASGKRSRSITSNFSHPAATICFSKL